MLEPDNKRISVRRQCDLLGLSRSTAYYRPRDEAPENLKLKERIDAQYTATPFYGVDRMTAHLRRGGWVVNPKRTRIVCPMKSVRSTDCWPQNVWSCESRYTSYGHVAPPSVETSMK